MQRFLRVAFESRVPVIFSESQFNGYLVGFFEIRITEPRISCFKYLTFFLFCEVDPYWDPGTQAHRSIALSISFKFLWGSSAVQPPYRGPRYCSKSPLLFAPDPSWQWSRSSSLFFPMSSIHIKHRMCIGVSFSAPHLLHENSLWSPHPVQHILQTDMPS